MGVFQLGVTTDTDGNVEGWASAGIPGPAISYNTEHGMGMGTTNSIGPPELSYPSKDYDAPTQNAINAYNMAREEYLEYYYKHAQTLYPLGIGLTADGAQGAANVFQESNAAVRAAAVRNNLPTAQIDKIMGNTSKFATAAKWAGRGVIVISAGISIYQGYNALNQGDMAGVKKAGLDLGVGLGATAIGGIPGVLLYGGYILIMQPPPEGTGYQHPNVILNDNTYVEPPVFPGF